MNKKQLEKYNKLLLENRQMIAGDINQIQEETLNLSLRDSSGDLSAYSTHIAYTADEDYNRSFSLELASTKEGLLKEIDAALDKIAEGKYGQCEKCGGRIPLKRLQAKPQARYCLKCKEQLEKESQL